MKKLIYIAACAGAVAFSSCADNFLDLGRWTQRRIWFISRRQSSSTSTLSAFITSLSDGSAVMTGFLTTWTVRQTFPLISATTMMWGRNHPGCGQQRMVGQLLRKYPCHKHAVSEGRRLSGQPARH